MDWNGGRDAFVYFLPKVNGPTLLRWSRIKKTGAEKPTTSGEEEESCVKMVKTWEENEGNKRLEREREK